MTAINENGQVYFTFEELDFDGAIQDLRFEIKYFKYILDRKNGLTTTERLRINKKIVTRNMIICKITALKYYELE